MKSDIYSQIDSNKTKTFVIMGLFIIFITFIIYVISSFYLPSESVWFITPVVFVFSSLSSFFSFWYSDKITLSLVGAKKANGPSFVLYNNIVENIAIAAGIPKPNTYYMVDNAPNAFATGRGPNHAAICVTSGLLENLNKAELEGVIAHEIAHIKNYDIRLMAVVSILVGFLATLIDSIFRFNIFGRSGNDDKKSTNGILALLFIVLLVITPIIAELIKLAISRNREYLADATGAYLTRYPKGLSDALVKISSYKGSVKKATTGNAHMFFANPLKNKGLINMFSTHPPVEERIKRLQSM